MPNPSRRSAARGRGPSPSLALAALLIGVASAAAVSSVQAQGRPDPAALMAAQREAMQPLARLDGLWRGPAWVLLPSGERHEMTQTERIGPMLDGSLKVIEGRSYDAAGRPEFNAFAVVSYDVATKAYRFASHAQGLHGDFVLRPTPDGFSWEIPAGPGVTIRYTAVVGAEDFVEVGERVVTGGEPVRIFEMTLKRVGATEWPAGGVVGVR